MAKYYLQLFLAIFTFEAFNAQCTVTAFTSPDTIVCGGCATLSAFGSATGNVAFEEDFNGGTPIGWQFTQSVTVADNTCGLTSPDGTDFMWMGDAAVNPRNMTTVGFDLSLGGSICFDMVYAEQGNASPCEGPDEPDEGVYVQYSIDNGVTWIDIAYYDPNGGSDPSLINWNTYCVTLPAGAQTTNTMIQWHQDDVSGSDYDHWGIDNVSITLNDPNYTISWIHDGYSYGLGSPGGDNPTDVCIMATTSYTVQMTDGTNTCSDVIEVVVVDPVLNVNAGNDTTICPGDCANLNGVAYEIVSPAKTPTFSNNEIDVVSGSPMIPVSLPCVNFSGCNCWDGSSVSIGGTCPAEPGSINAEMNINVQNMNQTSVSSGFITGICLTDFSITPGIGCTATSLADIEIVVVCPDGTEVILAGIGSLTGNTITNMCFDLGAGAYTASTAPYTGTFAPANSWNAFNGCTSNGVWTMILRGDNFETCVPLGSISGWSISFDDPEITAPVNYSWSPTAGLTNPTSLNPNTCPTATETYTLSATDLNGCITVTDDVTIALGVNGTAPCGVTTCTPPTLATALTHESCAGVSDGEIDLTVTGSSTYSFSWDNTATTEDLTGLAANTYTVIVTDQADATCTATTTVTINPGTQPTVVANASSINACANDMITLTGSGATSYTWDNGAVDNTPFAITATTTYTVTGTDGNGCTNTDDVTVTVTACTTPNASFNSSAVTLCEGDCLSFTNTSTNIPPGSFVGWNFPGSATANSTVTDPTGICYPTAGAYWVTLVYTDASFAVIDSTGIAINVTVCSTAPPVADFSASSTTLCEADCIDFTDLSTSTATGGLTTWAWDFGNGQTSTVQNPTGVACYATAGTYTVTLTVTDANGTHTETKTSYVTVTACAGPQPVADFSASSTTLCETDCIDFTDLSTSTATGGLTTWAWDFGNGLTSTLQNPTNICYTVAGNYAVTLTVTDANGTDTETKVSYVVVSTCVGPTASFNVVPNTTICEGDCIGFVNTSINVPAGAVVGWNFPGATPANSTANSPSNICYNTAGTYWATLVIADASFNVLDSTGVAITVNACVPPIAGFTFSPSGPFCADSCITFTSTSTYTPTATFAWDFGNGQGNSSENPGSPICFNTAGTFNVTLTVTDANGTDSETQSITIEDCSPPTAGFTISDNVICEGECIFINNTSTNGTFYQWAFEGGDPPASYLPFPGNVCFEDAGTFAITLVAGNNYGTDTIFSEVVVNPSPSVQTSEDQVIYSSHETQIEAVSSDPNVTYIWSPTEWMDCPDCAVTTVTPEDTIIYVVTVTNEFGCSDSSGVLIEVEYIEEIGVPSAFSPNGDGRNDILFVQGAGISNMEFKIYNRYGQMVFESTDQEYGWDGNFQGKEENTGVFVYYVIYDNSTSTGNILEGNVTLIR